MLAAEIPGEKQKSQQQLDQARCANWALRETSAFSLEDGRESTGIPAQRGPRTDNKAHAVLLPFDLGA